MQQSYGVYEDGNRDRDVTPSQFYRTIPGFISRVEVKSLDVRAGREDVAESHFLELTVDLQTSAGLRAGSGSTRKFKLKTNTAIAGLMRDLDAKVFTELLRKSVLTHYDGFQTPAYVAISHPSVVRTPAEF